MNRRIREYPLDLVDYQKIEVPYKSKVLSVINRRNNLVLYIDVNDITNEDMVEINIVIVGTGNPTVIPSGALFIGTVSTYDGDSVWHIFEY